MKLLVTQFVKDRNIGHYFSFDGTFLPGSDTPQNRSLLKDLNKEGVGRQDWDEDRQRGSRD
jgi:hypothetical protein